MPDPGDSPQLATVANRLTLDVLRDAGDWAAFEPVEDRVQAAGHALVSHKRFKRLAPCEACVALSADATVRRLNAAYRAKDKPTNVLSFPASAPHIAAGHPRLLGDVILGQETVLREAAGQGIAPAHHLQHLVVHGLLHLLGFDHETSTQALEMEKLETEILASLGIADPHAEPVDETAPMGQDH